MTMPLVSVVIPCFNHEHYLSAAIDSVIAQAWSNVEIIVVDDGSTDDSVHVARRYLGNRVVRKKNAGLSAARNTGLALCTGEYVVFLDADDRLLPVALQAGVACLDEHRNAAFAWGRYQLLIKGSAVAVSTAATCKSLATYDMLLRGNFIAMHATVMYRRSTLVVFGGFDENLTACEDYELYLRMTRTCQVVHHDQVVAEYRRHDGNMSYDSHRMLESALAVLASQEPLTRQNVSLERSRQLGISHWKQFYGLRSFRRLFRQLSNGQFHQARNDFRRILKAVGPGHLLLHFPMWVFSHIARKHAESKLSQLP